MSRNMCATAVRSANMRRPEGMHPTAATCPPKPAAMSAKACAVSSATVSAAAMSAAAMSAAAMSPATMPAAAAATPAAGVCFEREKRHDQEQHRDHAGAGRQHQLHGAAGLGPLHRWGRLNLGISPRTKSF